MSKNTLKLSIFLKAILFLLPLFLSNCGKEEFVDTSVPILESYIFTDIDYPGLNTTLKNMQPYVFNKGGNIEELGDLINAVINFTEQQSDTTTLLVYRHDVTYPIKELPFLLYKNDKGDVVLDVTYKMDKNDKENEERHINILCLKVPKILGLNTFYFKSALQITF